MKQLLTLYKIQNIHMFVNQNRIYFQNLPQVHGGGSSHSYRHGPSHMFLWYHLHHQYYHQHYIHWIFCWHNSMFKYTFVYLYLWIYLCIFIFNNILCIFVCPSWLQPQPSTPPPIPIIPCRTTWCWNSTLLKLMSNSKIIFAVFNVFDFLKISIFTVFTFETSHSIQTKVE